MRDQLLQVLPRITKPSQYLGTEKNRVYKSISEVDVHIALAFPDLYEIGMSYFGIQILYDILNRELDIYAEEVFAPAPDFEKELRDRNLPLPSLETKTPLAEFDVIGFSLLYELNYTNILRMLHLSNIPFAAKDRDLTFPIIIAGGPAAMNPEPVAELFDAMLIGDGEEVLLEMMKDFKQWKEKKGTKKELLEKWAKIEGVYIPSFFEPIYKENQFTGIKSLLPDYRRVKRAIVPDLEKALFPEHPIVPYGKPVHDRLRLEVSRGCTRGCRFCQAGMIYRPVRERTKTEIVRLAQELYANTGCDEMSFLSLSVGDYSKLVPAIRGVNQKLKEKKVAISFPSIRAEAITDELMEEVKEVRKTGFTIAPEAGSERLRRVINKSMTTQDIENAVKTAFQRGWKSIKLYFMIGLPTETREDLQETLQLIERLTKTKKGTAIHASFACFIPKPHTPFQWAKQATYQEAVDKIQFFKRNLGRHAPMKWQDPAVSVVEGVFSRGDRRLLKTLICAWEKGCRLDGWSDYFDFSLWQNAFAETGVIPDEIFQKNRKMTDPLPWDHIHIGVTKAYLEMEWQKAKKELATPDCRKGYCSQCGVCDFSKIRPKVGLSEPEKVEILSGVVQNEKKWQKFHFTYQKIGDARFLGHLELMQLLLRAFRRIHVEIRYSNGFHPHPKIRFENPLPLGMESEKENVYVELFSMKSGKEIQKELNRELPEGLIFLEVKPEEKQQKTPSLEYYRIGFFSQHVTKDEVELFCKNKSILYEWKTKKGDKFSQPIWEMIDFVSFISENELEMGLKRMDQKTIRPKDVLQTAFGFTPEALLDVWVRKINGTKDGKTNCN